MNQEIQAKLLEWLNSGEAFVKSQAPEYVNQALAFYAWDAEFGLKCAIAATILGVLLLIAAAFFSRDWENEGSSIVCTATGLVFAIVGPIGMISNYSDLKKIEIAPKVFLVEKIIPKKCK